MKEWRLCKEVEATEVKESGETEAEGGNKPFDKEYWKDKECLHCNNKGHPSTIFPDA